MKRDDHRWANKSKFSSPRSRAAIAVVLVVSILLIALGAFCAYDSTVGSNIIGSIFNGEKLNSETTVTGIEFPSDALGMTADLNEVYVRLSYSDGSSREIPLAKLDPQGLDQTVEGKQKFTVKYGGQEWKLEVEVVSADVTISYLYTDGGHLEGTLIQTLPAGQNCSTVRAVPDEGYDFAGWDDGYTSATRRDSAVSKDASYRAIFEKKTYTVRFRRADGTYQVSKVKYGDPVEVPSGTGPYYKKYGKTFIGWDVESYSVFESIKSDMDFEGLYADNKVDFEVYVTSESSIRVDSDGEYVGALGYKDTFTTQASHDNGSSSQTSEISSVPTSSGLDRTAIKYLGYYEYGYESSKIKVEAASRAVLAKWLIETSDGNYVELAPSGASTEVSVLSPDIAPVAFYSSAEGSSYTLSFTLNKSEEASVLRVIAVMEYETNSIAIEEMSALLGRIELAYNMSLDADKMIDAISDSVTFLTDSYGEVVLRDGLPVPIKYGYEFDGWYIKNSLTRVTSSTLFSESTSVEARYVAGNFSVSFMAGESELSSDSSGLHEQSDVAYTSTIGTAFCVHTPTKAYHTFIGWFEEGASSPVTANTVVTGDMVLYPRFTPTPHALNITMVNGQTDISTRDVMTSGSVYVLDTAPTVLIEEGSMTVGTDSYKIYPSGTIGKYCGTYLDGTLSIGGEKKYFVYGDDAYVLSDADYEEIYRAGRLYAFTSDSITYYLFPDEETITVKTGSYYPSSRVLTTSGNRYYLGGTYNYKMTEQSGVVVNYIDGALSSFRLGDMPYYHSDGIVYYDAAFTARAGEFDPSNGILTLDAAVYNYYLDKDEKKIYSLSSVASSVSAISYYGDSVSVFTTGGKKYYINSSGEVFESAGVRDGVFLSTETATYYIDSDLNRIYTATKTSLVKTDSYVAIGGVKYLLDGSSVLTEVGSYDGRLYSIGDDRYLKNSDVVYLLSAVSDAMLNVGYDGKIFLVKDGSEYEVVDSIVDTGAELLYPDIADYVDGDTSSRQLLETYAYLYRMDFSSDYSLDYLKINGSDVTEGVATTSTGIIIALAEYLSAPYTLREDINVEICLKLRTVRVVINHVETEGSSFVNDEETTSKEVGVGGSAEIKIVAPENMAIRSVTLDGVAQSLNRGATEFYLRLIELISDVEISVTYETLSYSVTIDGVSGDRVDYNGEFSETFSATEGKYISALYYNGVALNFYSTASSYSAVSVSEVNYTSPVEGATDPRVTALTFSIAKVTENIELKVVYSDIYYSASVSVEGKGELKTAPVRSYGYNGSIGVLIEESLGYRISQCLEIRSGVTKTYTTDIPYLFDNLKEDITLIYTVTPITYGVGVTSDRDIEISLDGEIKSGKLFSYDVEYNDEPILEISAGKDSYVASVTIDGESIAIPYRQNVVTLFLGRITSPKSIVVSSAELPSEQGDGAITVKEVLNGSVSVMTESGLTRAFLYGEEVTLRVIPDEGFTPISVSIARSGSVQTVFLSSFEDKGGYYEYVFTAPETGDISIESAIFNRKEYSVTLTDNGHGTAYQGIIGQNGLIELTSSATVSFDMTLNLTLSADDGYYVRDVLVDGVSVDEYLARTVNSANGKNSAVTVAIKVRRNTSVEVIYEKDSFTVTSATSPYGTVTTDRSEYGSGEDVVITISSAVGYHVSRLFVNSVEIKDFLPNTEEDLLKYNTTVNYVYSGIRQNLSVVAEFEINTYVLNYYAYNYSINFASVDYEYDSYGSISLRPVYSDSEFKAEDVTDGISGSGETTYSATYRGISHGDSLILDIEGLVRSGYRVRAVSLSLNSGATVRLTASATSDAYDVRFTTSGVTITLKSIKEDVRAIVAEYDRRTVTLSASFVDDPIFSAGPVISGENAVGWSFYNDRSDKVPSVDTVDGAYVVEYGIRYRIVLNPDTGYKLDSFKVNGSETGYVTSFSAGTYYESTATADRNFVAQYKRLKYTLTLDVTGAELGTASFSGTSAMTKTLYYGESASIVLSPDYLERGGYVYSFTLNGAEQSVDGTSDSVYVISDVKQDIAIAVTFEKIRFDVSYTAGVGGTVNIENLSGEHFIGTVKWGDSVQVTIDLDSSYDLSEYSVGGKTIPVTDDLVTETATGKRIVFTVDSIKSDVIVSLPYRLKKFSLSVTSNGSSYGSVGVVSRDDNVAVTDVIECTKSYVFNIIPSRGFVIDTVNFRMKNAYGVAESVSVDRRVLSDTHTDAYCYTLISVSGDVTVDIKFAPKSYVLTVGMSGETASTAIESLTLKAAGLTKDLNNFLGEIKGVAYGSTITLSVTFNSGYDISGYFIVNNRNYYGDKVAPSRIGNSFVYEVTFTVDDELVNVRTSEGDLVIGSGDNFYIDMSFNVNAELYKENLTVLKSDEELLSVVDDVDDILSVTDKATFTYGRGLTFSVKIKTPFLNGYYVSELYIDRSNYGYDTPDVPLSTLGGLEYVYRDGYLVEVTGTLIINDTSLVTYTEDLSNSKLFEKSVVIKLKLSRRVYTQQATEFVYDSVSSYTDAGEVSLVSVTAADYSYLTDSGAVRRTGKLNHSGKTALSTPDASTAVPDDRSTTGLPFGAIVTVETGLNADGYYFYGFEEYKDGAWLALDSKTVTMLNSAKTKFEYTVDSDRIFRAVYVKYYDVSFTMLPFHKATTGVAPDINYVSYASLVVNSVDAIEGKEEKNITPLTNLSTTDKKTYRVGYGSLITVEGKDSLTTGRNANASTGVAFYDSTSSPIPDATTPSAYSTCFEVKDSGSYYAVFNNNVETVITYETVGGADATEGGVVTVLGDNDKAISATRGNGAFSYKTAAYKTIKIRIKINDFYRIEGFYELEATNRTSTDNLIFKDISDDDSFIRIFGYSDLYVDADGDGAADSDTASLNKANYFVTRDGEEIVVTVFVLNNAIYKIKYVKTFEIDTEYVIGYAPDGSPVEGDSDVTLYSPDNEALRAPSGKYRFDYGSYVTMSIPDSDAVATSDDYQFIGWYLESKGTESNLLELAGKYFNEFKREYYITLDADRLADKVDLYSVDSVKIVLEYLPVYTLYINHAYDYLGSSRDFKYATEQTSLTTVVYSSETLGLSDEIRTSAYTESQPERSVASDLRMMSGIVDIDGGYSDTVNYVTVRADVLTSYSFNYWEYSFDGVDYSMLYGTENLSSYTFNIVELSAGISMSGRILYLRPNLSKINNVTVSRVVYYDSFGTPSSNASALRDTGVYIGTLSSTSVSGIYGDSVTVTATHADNYRFLGWFDKTGKQVNDLTLTSSSAELSLTVALDKCGGDNYGTSSYYTDYTYELEARFIREVTVTFMVLNASARGDVNYSVAAPYIYGVEASSDYYGADNRGIVIKRTTSDTSSIVKDHKLQKVELTMDAGSYAVLKLTTESNEKGFDPSCMFRSGFAAGGSCYYNEEDDYYTLPFNYDRSVTVQYVTYGNVVLENLLPDITLTLPKTIADTYKEGVDVAVANGIDVSALYGIDSNYYLSKKDVDYTLRIDGNGELVIETDGSGNVDIVIPYIKKADYNSVTQKVKLSQMKSGYIVETYNIGFSYKKHSGTEITIDLSDKGYMPFTSGTGSASDPYIIASPKQLAAIEALYRTTSNSPDVSGDEIISFNGLDFVSYISNSSKYSVSGIYFKLDDTVPASERYMSLGAWQPLTRDGQGFNSTFDGSEWEIGNITVTGADGYYGIFGKAYKATFRDVDFMGGNSIVAEGDYVGLLTGYAKDVRFVDINVKGNNESFLGGMTTLGVISSKGDYIGTLAGYADNCVLENVYLRLVTVIGVTTPTPSKDEGGETIKDDYGNIVYETVGGKYVGGVFGYAVDTDIGSDSTSTTLNNVTVQGGSYIGGVAGEFLSKDRSVGITNITFLGNSLSFGIKDQSFIVGGAVGHMGAGTSMEKVYVSTSSVKITVSGYYRNMSRNSVLDNTEEFSSTSAIGGLVGINEGTVNDLRLTQGSIGLNGSVAGGFIGFNKGTAVNLYIAIAGRVSVNTQHSGYYGGMIGHNVGLVDNCRIGSYGTFSGLSSDASQLISSSNIEGNVNVSFVSDGAIALSGETFTDKKGVIHTSWGFNAMGGMIGVNGGKVYNSVTYGKVIAYSRLGSGADAFSALGGIIGANLNSSVPLDSSDSVIRVVNCGSSYAITVNYTVMALTSTTELSLNVAVGSIIGHHGTGFASGLYSYHPASAAYFNIGSPSGEDSYSAASLTSHVTGIASSLAGMGFGTFQSSWAYYNEASSTKARDGGITGNHKITDVSITRESLSAPFVAYDAVNGYGPEPEGGWNRFNVFPTNANYNTMIGSTTASVYNTTGADISSFFKAFLECSEGYGMQEPYNSQLYASDGAPYRIDPSTGLPTSEKLGNTYGYSSSKTSAWMI